MQKTLSIVAPCYNEELAIRPFYDEVLRVSKKLKDVELEFVFVDDGSRDRTLAEIQKLRKEDKRVRFVSFSRNFGKEAGLLAGLEYAKGDYVVTMDVDLQDPPELLPEMYEAVASGEYDCAGARRVSRKGEPPIRSFFAGIYYKIINRLSNIEMVDGVRDFRLMDRKMVDAVLSMPEYNRYSKGIFSFVGFKTKWVEFEHVDRVAGETHWSFWKLFVYGIEAICAFSTVPLVLAAVLGLLFCFIAFVMVVVIIWKTLAFGDPVGGWPSMICAVLMMGGLQLMALGVIGQYLAKTYLETKRRPIYIVRTTEKDDKTVNDGEAK